MASCKRIECVVRGYHTYKVERTPAVGDRFETEVDDFNEHDRYAVKVTVDDIGTVGHIPHEISKICYYFFFKWW